MAASAGCFKLTRTLKISPLANQYLIEPGNYKTNKMTVRPVKTQISLGICPVWLESSLSAWRKLGASSTHWAHSEDWSDALPDMRLRWAHRSFCWFCHAAAQLSYYHNVPKFWGGQIWANSADPDQTAPRGAVWSGSTLFAIPSASFGCITLRKRHLIQLLGWLQQIFGCAKF